MQISVFGLGYVGCVSAACLAKEGHQVIGVDTNIDKVEMINAGKSPIIEKGLDEILKEVVSSNKLKATISSKEGIFNSEISLICVGTPGNENGSLDLRYINRVCIDIGESLAQKDSFHIVVVRSTMLPGTIKSVVIPTLEKTSVKKAGRDFGICINPEFLREGSSIYDYYHPPKILIGELNKQSGDAVVEIYKDIDSPVVRTSIEVAEMVKYVNNTFHALKVCFANEIGNICKQKGIDSHQVMDIFCLDTKLNLSPYYLKPGFAYGGSCLPKDLRALLYEGKKLDLTLPILDAIQKSNEYQINLTIKKILNSGKKKIGIFGFSFKAGTDDLRESPMVTLIEALIGKGYVIKIYDRNVHIARLFGANKKYIEETIPHIALLMCDSMEKVIEDSDVLVIGNKAEEFKQILHKMTADKIIIDLVRVFDKTEVNVGKYDGICW
ncbi:MAG: UDP-glucose/GDP-mannose dehydrogenase family protein [bacterium]